MPSEDPVYYPSDKTISELYSELKRLAAAKLAGERNGHTLSATDLLHESFLRLQGTAKFQDRKHYFAAAAQAMRRLLVDHARHKKAAIHGGNLKRVEFEDLPIEPYISSSDELLDVHEALKEMSKVDLRMSKVVELRFFGGFSVAEVAELLEISERTVKREWEFARAWLFEALTGT